MNKKELPVFSVILYVSAAVMAVAAGFMAYPVLVEIVDVLVAGNLSFFADFDIIINYATSSFSAYVVYALLLAAAGVTIQYAATAAHRAMPHCGTDHAPEPVENAQDDGNIQ